METLRCAVAADRAAEVDLLGGRVGNCARVPVAGRGLALVAEAAVPEGTLLFAAAPLACGAGCCRALAPTAADLAALCAARAERCASFAAVLG